MKKFTAILTALAGSLMPLSAQPAGAACGPTHYPCQAAQICYLGAYSGWGAVNICGSANEGTCTAWRWSNGDTYHVTCSSMGNRGDDADVLADIFKAGRPVTDGEGKLIEIDQATGEMIQVATSISALQRRGVAIGPDVNAAFSDAGIPLVESVDVEVAADTNTGGQTFTLRGGSDDEYTLRFDADGNRIADAPDLVVSGDVQAAMIKASESSSTMSARGEIYSWCAQARATTGGCAVAASTDVRSIPGAAGAPPFKSAFPSVPSSANVFSAASFPANSWSIPNAYNAISLVEYFNLGFIRTQSELDRFLAFCWVPNPSVSGSGSCQANYHGVCPYDANAGVTCQSMSGAMQ